MDDSQTGSTILILALLIIASAFFSGTETAFSSCSKIKLKSWAEDGNRKAEATLALVEDYDRLLSGVLIGNNIVNITASTLATLLFTSYWATYGPTLSTVVMTVLVLIFGEVTPKTLVKQAPERFAIAVTPVIRAVLWVLTPINAVFRLWQRMLNHFFKPDEGEGITGGELITMVSEAENEGGLEAGESKLIRSAIEFGDLEVGEIFVPRVDMVSAPDDTSTEEMDALFRDCGYSRLPIWHEDRDHILGVLNEKDFFQAHLGPEDDWHHLMTEPLYTTPSEPVQDVLSKMQRQKTHLAIVVDEFGGTEGLITLEDILEELVGEIWDEHDEVVESFKKQPDGSYLIACSANLDDVFELFDVRGECDSDTVSGWVLDELGHIPKVGDRFTYENLEVTVTAIRRMRVLEIRVVVLPEEPEENHWHPARRGSGGEGGEGSAQ
ncbi:MAG: hemolysin family protein [Clostridiales bacterium]|nr:hemolysin family protein [Clostridiales bacterium]